MEMAVAYISSCMLENQAQSIKLPVQFRSYQLVFKIEYAFPILRTWEILIWREAEVGVET